MNLQPRDFREFTEAVKGAAQAGIAGLRGSRMPTPMLHLLTREGIGINAIDPAFFERGHEGRRVQLVERYIIPMIAQHEALMVGWTFAGQAPGNPVWLATAIAMDREVHETWLAPIAETTPMTIGAWTQLAPNEQAGLLLTPIQEALR